MFSQRLFYSLFAIMGIILLGVFFFWPTYLNGTLKIYNRIYYIIIALLTVWYVIKNKYFYNKHGKFIMLFLVLVLCDLYFYRNYLATGINYAGIAILLPLFITFITFLHENGKKEIFLLFKKYFAIVMLPSIFIWGLLILGIEIPYINILPNSNIKIIGGQIYRCYLGISIILTGVNNSLPVDRLCGIFDEPGVVGTISALLLIADGISLKKFKKWDQLTILIAGILSFSTAFYIMIGLSIFCKILSLKLELAIVTLPLLILSYVIFINMPITFAPLERVQNAIMIENGKLKGDNRESVSANMGIDNIIKHNKLKLLVGAGHLTSANDPLLAGSWSFRIFVYDRGVLSTLIYFLQIFIMINLLRMKLKFNADQKILIFIFLLSLYQRPEALHSIAYLIILAGGIVNLSYNSNHTLIHGMQNIYCPRMCAIGNRN